MSLTDGALQLCIAEKGLDSTKVARLAIDLSGLVRRIEWVPWEIESKPMLSTQRCTSREYSRMDR